MHADGDKPGIRRDAQTAGMPTSERRRDRALALAAAMRRDFGGQVRTARRSHGLSLRAAAGSVGLDWSTFARIERGEVRTLSLEHVALAAAAVALAPILRSYPAGDAVRDAASLKLLARFRARLPRGAPWATEVPMPIPGDLRALDGWSRLMDSSLGVEAETQLYDLQAQTRRALLKQRDADVDVLILLVADTARNRDALRLHREALRGSFPLDTRAVLRSVSRNEPPSANGIVVL